VTKYFLSKHVHLRRVGDGAVLLDLHRDEYLSFSREQVSALGAILRGSPDEVWSITAQTATDAAGLAQFASGLLERGLLTIKRASGKFDTPVEIKPAETSLLDQNTAGSMPHPFIALGFLSACIRTSLAMRLRPIRSIISAVEQRKRTHLRISQQANVSKAQTLVSAYLFLRPFVYTHHEECLFDSLVLVNFLAAYGIFPTLIFGVRTAPFEAHAWVQEGHCAFNCAVEHVRSFLPIMAI
jgi:hypothetical protein